MKVCVVYKALRIAKSQIFYFYFLTEDYIEKKNVHEYSESHDVPNGFSWCKKHHALLHGDDTSPSSPLLQWNGSIYRRRLTPCIDCTP